MKLVKRIIFLFSFIIIFPGLANLSHAYCVSKYCLGKIEKMYIAGGAFGTANGVVYIGTDGDETQLNCNAPSGVYITLSTSDAMFEEKYTALLMAVGLKRDVQLRIVENDAKCTLSYVVLQ